jgi:Mrp family chromosome partitioning ATPase
VDYGLLASMINAEKEVYDLIILDGPPMTVNADFRMLAHIAQNVLVVADYRQLSYRTLEKSIQFITQTGSSVMGIVVNCVPRRKVL